MKELEDFAKFMTEQLTPSQKAFKAKAHLLDWYSFKQDMKDPVFRQTGRTQVIAVCTILTAVLEPGKAVEFHDHAGFSNGGKRQCDDKLRERVERLVDKARAAGVEPCGRFVISKETITYNERAKPLQSPYRAWIFFWS